MRFLNPSNLHEALTLLSKFPDCKILAGGTDVCVQLRGGGLKPKAILNIWGLNELKNIRDEGRYITIGALSTHTDIIRSPLIHKHIPVLAKACRTIGAVQVQNRGTIGGNVMNASPAGDTLPVLMAYAADVEVTSIAGQRWVPFEGFFTGYRATVVRPGEMVTGFRIAWPPRGERADFIKIGSRKAITISKVMACFRARIEHKKIVGISIAFGSVAPVPLRLKQTEAFLMGRVLTHKTIDEAVNKLASDITPINDIRSTADYRRHCCGVFLRRFLLESLCVS
ncbi:MAG: xanthine dehydrogenase family protein subunit M [Deltaproteobacteria bacterium]|nr:xanthine dehydrogenase family protein subunit M [Deltaproteobacteria bacterium]